VIPLFPLHTVLFPGGSLPLKIFEARYLDLISRCLRDDSGFGVNLIRAGAETGAAATCWPVGTYARITDWQSLSGGLLGVTVTGGKRYRILNAQTGDNNLLQGDVDWLQEGQALTAADLEREEHAWLRPLLEHYRLLPAEETETGTGGLIWRLADALPLPLPARQSLLELDSDVERLAELRKLLQQPARQ